MGTRANIREQRASASLIWSRSRRAELHFLQGRAKILALRGACGPTSFALRTSKTFCRSLDNYQHSSLTILMRMALTKTILMCFKYLYYLFRPLQAFPLNQYISPVTMPCFIWILHHPNPFGCSLINHESPCLGLCPSKDDLLGYRAEGLLPTCPKVWRLQILQLDSWVLGSGGAARQGGLC